MAQSTGDRRDSQLVEGGRVPGNPGVPAFSLRTLRPSPIPVLISVPHAGRAYATSLLERMRHPAFATPRLEDRFADLLGERVAAETDAALLVAHAPRATIDLNRAVDDVDWEMVSQPAPDASAAAGSSLRRARSGLGLIPRRLPGLGELWKRRFDRHELDERIAGVHEPYHAALGATLADLRARWGAALLIDLHSMPPLQSPIGGERAAELVVGDRFGASCGGELIAASFAQFAAEGWRAAHNRPYAGGYVLERHGRRQDGIHAIQLEIDRRCYLDGRLVEPGPGFERTVAMLVGLVRRLAGVAAELGGEGGASRWRAAAE